MKAVYWSPSATPFALVRDLGIRARVRAPLRPSSQTPTKRPTGIGPPENARGGVLADAAPTTRGGTSCVLGLANVRRLQPLRAARHVELERLTLGERLETIARDGREMDE